MLANGRHWALALLALISGSGLASSCAKAEVQRPEGNSERLLHDELNLGPLEQLPVPDADGPPLAPLSLEVPVRAAPSRDAHELGYLRVGARVARSERPVSLEGCPGGWYAVRPIGFVCAEGQATIDLENPVARALQVEPDRSHAMPYAYAFLRAVAPNYLRVPTKTQQFEREMSLERHLRSWSKLREEWDKLDIGANDVPLDETGLALGARPEQPLPLDISQRYGGPGVANEARPWWLQGNERKIPNLSAFNAPSYADIAGRSQRHAGLALIGSFVAKDGEFERRFAITTDARLVPADKLKADTGSTFHGGDISDVGLPVAFPVRPGASYWELKNGDLVRAGRPELRELIPLNGKIQRFGGQRMVQARNGKWLRSDDVRAAVKPTTLPWFAAKKRHWIQVSLLSQTLVLWEGATPVYATLVSTGRDGMGDPKTTLSTPTGTFRILEKHVTTTMDSQVADHEFELRDVPWVMYFQGGYALHGAYWHDDFGRARSHGCVNLAPIDARYVFFWSSPEVPEHWHGAMAGDAFDKGTIVQIVP
ncbi:MAG TPA: L,D-transpeptidase [Polyangiaceae bacterium]|nr:L,D-transpeptidase [Polyangiaceae bacterium]